MYMASGIALLSMYNDDDEEEGDGQQKQQEDIDDDDSSRTRIATPNCVIAEPIPLKSPTPPPRPAADGQKGRGGVLAIVDYASMSPEAAAEILQEGELVSSGYVVVGMEIDTCQGNFEERTPPGTVQLLSPTSQPEPPQPSGLPEQSKSETTMATYSNGTEPQIAQAEIAAVISEEVQKDDPLKSFLPPVTSKCPEELQETINKLLAYKKAGKSINVALREMKDYRNPDLFAALCEALEIDQMGTCFSKDVFDPWCDKNGDYFDEIEADMKREMERKENERKKSQKVDFFPRGNTTWHSCSCIEDQHTDSGCRISAVVPCGSVSTAPDAPREIRQKQKNNKSKWDKLVSMQPICLLLMLGLDIPLLHKFYSDTALSPLFR